MKRWDSKLLNQLKTQNETNETPNLTLQFNLTLYTLLILDFFLVFLFSKNSHPKKWLRKSRYFLILTIFFLVKSGHDILSFSLLSRFTYCAPKHLDITRKVLWFRQVQRINFAFCRLSLIVQRS